MSDAKPWWQSRTMWGLVIAAVATILKSFGVELDAGFQDQLVEIGLTVGTAAGLILAAWGRLKATRPIGKPAASPPDKEPPHA